MRTVFVPWYVVEADEKRNARLNCFAHPLFMIPYEVQQVTPVALPPRQPDEGYVRPDRSTMTCVSDHAATLHPA